MRLTVLALSLVIWSLQAVHADECMGKAETQPDMDLCALNAYKTSDTELNWVYREIERRLGDDAATRKLLIAAQRAWLSFRDAECAFAASDAEGGSIYPMVYNQCLDSLTQARIDDLQQYLKCQEGDLGCPVPSAS